MEHSIQPMVLLPKAEKERIRMSKAGVFGEFPELEVEMELRPHWHRQNFTILSDANIPSFVPVRSGSNTRIPVHRSSKCA